jgi:hypothetical protein
MFTTSACQDRVGGNRRRALKALKAAFGNRAEVLRSEEERLRGLSQALGEEDLE